MEKLRSCPFCRSVDALTVLDQNESDEVGKGDKNYTESPYYKVVCCMVEMNSIPAANWNQGCGASGGYRETKEQAIAAWNHRAGQEERLADTTKTIADDYPCSNPKCYDIGNYCMSCEKCPCYKGWEGGQGNE